MKAETPSGENELDSPSTISDGRSGNTVPTDYQSDVHSTTTETPAVASSTELDPVTVTPATTPENKEAQNLPEQVSTPSTEPDEKLSTDTLQQEIKDEKGNNEVFKSTEEKMGANFEESRASLYEEEVIDDSEPDEVIEEEEVVEEYEEEVVEEDYSEETIEDDSPLDEQEALSGFVDTPVDTSVTMDDSIEKRKRETDKSSKVTDSSVPSEKLDPESFETSKIVVSDDDANLQGEDVGNEALISQSNSDEELERQSLYESGADTQPKQESEPEPPTAPEVDPTGDTVTDEPSLATVSDENQNDTELRNDDKLQTGTGDTAAASVKPEDLAELEVEPQATVQPEQKAELEGEVEPPTEPETEPTADAVQTPVVDPRRIDEPSQAEDVNKKQDDVNLEEDVRGGTESLTDNESLAETKGDAAESKLAPESSAELATERQSEMQPAPELESKTESELDDKSLVEIMKDVTAMTPAPEPPVDLKVEHPTEEQPEMQLESELEGKSEVQPEIPVEPEIDPYGDAVHASVVETTPIDTTDDVAQEGLLPDNELVTEIGKDVAAMTPTPEPPVELEVEHPSEAQTESESKGKSKADSGTPVKSEIDPSDDAAHASIVDSTGTTDEVTQEGLLPDGELLTETGEDVAAMIPEAELTAVLNAERQIEAQTESESKGKSEADANTPVQSEIDPSDDAVHAPVVHSTPIDTPDEVTQEGLLPDGELLTETGEDASAMTPELLLPVEVEPDPELDSETKSESNVDSETPVEPGIVSSGDAVYASVDSTLADTTNEVEAELLRDSELLTVTGEDAAATRQETELLADSMPEAQPELKSPTEYGEMDPETEYAAATTPESESQPQKETQVELDLEAQADSLVEVQPEPEAKPEVDHESSDISAEAPFSASISIDGSGRAEIADQTAVEQGILLASIANIMQENVGIKEIENVNQVPVMKLSSDGELSAETDIMVHSIPEPEREAERKIPNEFEASPLKNTGDIHGTDSFYDAKRDDLVYDVPIDDLERDSNGEETRAEEEAPAALVSSAGVIIPAATASETNGDAHTNSVVVSDDADMYDGAHVGDLDSKVTGEGLVPGRVATAALVSSAAVSVHAANSPETNDDNHTSPADASDDVALCDGVHVGDLEPNGVQEVAPDIDDDSNTSFKQDDQQVPYEQQQLIGLADQAIAATDDGEAVKQDDKELMLYNLDPDFTDRETSTKQDDKEITFCSIDSDFTDLEGGRSPNDDEESAGSSRQREESALGIGIKGDGSNKHACNRTTVLGLFSVFCLILVALAVTLPILLLGDNNNENRDISNKTKAPDEINPTPAPRPKYELASGPFDDDPSTGFGRSISLSDGLLLIGLPSDGQGLVRNINGEQEGSGFGWAVDVAGSVAAIGSPFLFIEDTPTQAGGVTIYEYTGSSWSQVGATLRGDEDLFAANEEFGSAVSLSVTENSYRVVVGAPISNLNDFEIGRVYTFERSVEEGSAWVGIESSALLGERAGDRFGSSVAISKDGTKFIAGGPGGDLHDDPGIVFVYEYTGGSGSAEAWELVFSIGGDEDNERFGASVAMLSDNGDTFAIGAPDYAGGSGRVVVFRKGGDGAYQQVGSDIVGERGERLGESNLLGGSASGGSVQVVVGIANGLVMRYDYSEQSRSWSKLFDEVDAGFSAVSSISVSGPNAALIAVGSEADGLVSIYNALGDITDPGPEPRPPVPSPVSPPAPSPLGSTTAPVPQTLAPIIPLLEWSIAGGPFSVNILQSGFGSSIAISDSQMAVGAPFAGLVKTYSVDPNGPWTESLELTSDETSDGFGYSLDIDGQGMLVGAPLAGGEGAAHYFEYASGQWTQIDGPIQSIAGPDGFFGSSVAVSASRVAVVGAVGYSGNGLIGRGAAYIFELSEGWALTASQLGSEAGDSLGHAVDIDSSGTMVVMGAPGNNGGYALVLEKKGSAWETTLVIEGENDGDGFGTSVKVLSPYYVAVGAPGYGQGRGRVVVYQRVRGTFKEMVDVVGEERDELGSSLKLAGSGTTLLVGRADGFVKRLDFDGVNSRWIQTTEVVDSGFGSGLGAIATPPDDPGTFAASGAERAVIYSLL